MPLKQTDYSLKTLLQQQMDFDPTAIALSDTGSEISYGGLVELAAQTVLFLCPHEA